MNKLINLGPAQSTLVCHTGVSVKVDEGEKGGASDISKSIEF